jgi:AraC-like DNA-binding protein
LLDRPKLFADATEVLHDVHMVKAPAKQRPDALGEALHLLRFTGMSYFRCELTAPWGLNLPGKRDTMFFHIVISGRCLLAVKGANPHWLDPGDIALVPRARGHRLASSSSSRGQSIDHLRCERVSELYSVLRHGGGAAPTTLVCGEARFDDSLTSRLAELLPAVILMPSRATRRDFSAQRTFALIASEARALRPGGETVIARLADVLVIQAIRAWVERDPAALGGWLGALRDPQIGLAISLMHRDPAQSWSLESLAAKAAMSRSSFAARFTQLVGEPAMRYLARWRMGLAENRLRTSDVKLSELAHDLGYESEAAFNRTFKRFVGITPGAARRRAGATGD